MNIQVISIGTEILLGSTVNTNLTYIGTVLDDCGLAIDREVCIPDIRAAIETAVASALSAADVVFTVGGLGPTVDDITRDVVAEALEMPLEYNETEALRIRSYFDKRNIEMNESMLRQAYVPVGADVVPNDYGTASGLWCKRGGRHVIMLPGPPRELKPMVSNHVMPRLTSIFPPEIARLTISVCGIPESSLEEQVNRILLDFPDVEPAYCVKRDKTDVRLTARETEKTVLQNAVAAVRLAFDDQVIDDDGGLVAAICRLLRELSWSLATAESCTGGGIGTYITDLAGVSDVFAGSLVTYSNELKTQLLGVRAETLASFGAVSAETAAEMVTGLASRLNVEAGIAVTGIAGPTGGTPEKPVGLVYVATYADGDVWTSEQMFPVDRQRMRDRTVISALNQLRRHLRRLVSKKSGK